MVLKVVIQQSTFNITYTFACVQIRHNPLSGGYCGEVPPLPIPNREVKLTCADGTAMQCGRVGSRLLLSRASDFERFLRLFLCFFICSRCFLSADDVDYTDFYYLCSMIWTDRIRQVKIFLVIAAVFIAVASLVVSHFLVRDLAEEERNRMAVWAEAMRTLNNADENTDLNLVLKVINENNSIPVIVMDSENHAQTFRNVDVEGKDYADSLAYASAIGQRLLKQGKNIKIELDDSTHDYIQVCYDESLMIRRLSAYPYIQLGVVMLFVVIAIFALLTSKRAEQNKVWVGLSKETAHQLGTPISSLMAWIEILKMNYPDDELIPEMNKDIQRLQLIADRFSKIGALPEPVPASLNEVMNHVIDYMDRRTSKNVKMVKKIPEQDVIVKMNASLFEWVIENLSKNAVDAMGANGGQITLYVEETDDKAIIEVSDTGNGIRKKDLKNVFRPGFTTKKRGWGLGLSLAKRIVEEYHHGKIWVKSTEIGHGTTFRIELKKE